MKNIIFKCIDDPTSNAVAPYDENELMFFNFLEEMLYILYELTPDHRGWTTDLETTGSTVFTYHRLDWVTVEWDENLQTVTLTEI